MHPLTPTEASQLIRRMLDEHSELLSGQALGRCLGYRSSRAFQRAARLGELPVEVFKLPGRRGRFARTIEVARWLAGEVNAGECIGAQPTEAASIAIAVDTRHV